MTRLFVALESYVNEALRENFTLPRSFAIVNQELHPDLTGLLSAQCTTHASRWALEHIGPLAATLGAELPPGRCATFDELLLETGLQKQPCQYMGHQRAMTLARNMHTRYGGWTRECLEALASQRCRDLNELAVDDVNIEGVVRWLVGKQRNQYLTWVCTQIAPRLKLTNDYGRHYERERARIHEQNEHGALAGLAQKYVREGRVRPADSAIYFAGKVAPDHVGYLATRKLMLHFLREYWAHLTAKGLPCSTGS